MTPFTYFLQNDWRDFRDSRHASLLGLSVTNDRFRCGVVLALLGFGVGVTYWKRAFFNLPEPTPAPEPIEHDGWAGEPQGMEKAP